MMFKSSDFRVANGNHLIAKSTLLLTNPSPNVIEIRSIKTGIVKIGTNKLESRWVDDARSCYRTLCNKYNWNPGPLRENDVTSFVLYTILDVGIQVIFFRE